MGTYHEDWATEALKHLNPKQRANLAQIHTLLLENHWGELQDVFFQDYRDQPCSVEDALAWSQLWEGISKGQILYVPVEIGHCPLTDKNRAANKSRLNEGLKKWQMEVEVWEGHGKDDDGLLKWKEDLIVDQAWFDSETAAERYRTHRIPAGSCALEIGATKGTRTLFHLRGDSKRGGVARWPYRSPLVWVLLPAYAYLDDKATLLQDRFKDDSGIMRPITNGPERLIANERLPPELRDERLDLPEYGNFAKSRWLKEFDDALAERGIKWPAAPDKPKPTSQSEPERSEDLYY